MNTTKTFLRKSSQIVIAVAVSLQLSQCDSSTDLTFNPNANFDVDNRYNKDELDANLGGLVEMPSFLASGDRITVEAFTSGGGGLIIDGEIITDDIDSIVRSSGQTFIGNFRYNYNDRFDTEDNVAFLIRSEDHVIGEDNNFVESLLQLRDTSNGGGSLAQALTVDPNDVGDGLVTLTQENFATIQNAIRSLGYVVDDNWRVLTDQFYTFEASSTNQLLVDENKISGDVFIVKTWRSLLFEYVTITTIDDNEPTVQGGEYKITLGDFIDTETDEGVFEIQLNSL
ncbi:MAG: hypothetical protein ACI9SQ_002030 [Rubritalea sp.]|jgi:hypothetical protein